MTEATNTLAALLEPHGDQLRLEPLEAARIFRLVTFASAHPTITDGQRLSTPEIVELLLHGISAAASRRSTAEKTSSGRSTRRQTHPPAAAQHPRDPRSKNPCSPTSRSPVMLIPLLRKYLRPTAAR